MAAQRKQKKINLLPQEEFAASPVGRVVTWLMSTFRVIVIITEMVVMVAFLSRFWLDTQIADLDENIKTLQVRIQSYSTFEKNWRMVQSRLGIFNSLTDTSNKRYPAISGVSAFMPSEISLDSFSSSQGKIQIKGVGLSEQSISQFLINLEASNRFEDIELVQIDSTDSSEITFTITAKVKATGAPSTAGGGV